MKQHIYETPQKNIRKSPRSGKYSDLRNDRQVRTTLRRWHRYQKRDARRDRFSQILQRLSYAGVLGDVLYMVGFWAEYAVVCAGRTALRVTVAIASHVGALLFLILRPLGIGLVVFLEDLFQPFIRLASGLRHIKALPEQYPEEDARQIRAEKFQYFKRGTKLYLPLVWNAFSYVLPVAALVGMVWVIQGQLSETYHLKVSVNGETVGFVESEQVFDNAREDVQSRINSALAIMRDAGVDTSQEQWNITPTYTLAVSDTVMTESEVADAIMRASSDEIGDGTAVYIDGALRFVTTDGDHLRSYLETVKAPYEDAFDENRTVDFVHNIRLVDGVYFLSSIVPYDTVLSTLNETTPGTTYTVPEDGQTAQEAAESTGMDFTSLQTLNPTLQTEDDELAAGTVLTTSQPTAELLQVKVVERQSVVEEIPYQTVETESDEYAFGKRITVQEGQNGQQEVVSNVTYIDGNVADVSIVEINVLQAPVDEQIVVGTHLSNGMVAHTGSGTFYWPVPNYKYVSRWMSSDHKGADIVAPNGTPIIAADSGVVEVAGWHNHPYGYGNYVIINHGNGWKTLYGHMSSIAVTSGQAVEAGQVIGYVGNTGYSFGFHCHFEMYYNNTLVSARQFFPNM